MSNSKTAAKPLSRHSVMASEDSNGDITVRIGANPDGTLTAKSEGTDNPNPSYANTKGWGAPAVLIRADGTQVPITLRINVTER